MPPMDAGATDGYIVVAGAAASPIYSAWCGACEALQPLGSGAGKFMDELRAVVEANQVSLWSGAALLPSRTGLSPY